MQDEKCRRDCLSGKTLAPHALIWPVCPAHCEKIFWFSEVQISTIFISSRPTEGRVAIVTAAGRDAVDADAPITNGDFSRTVKSCGPDTPMLVSSLREVAQATVAKTPGAPGRARYTLLKPLRGECRVIPV